MTEEERAEAEAQRDRANRLLAIFDTPEAASFVAALTAEEERWGEDRPEPRRNTATILLDHLANAVTVFETMKTQAEAALA